MILYLKYRNKANIVRLQEALDTLDILKQNIALSETSNNNTEISNNKVGSDKTDNDDSNDITSDSSISDNNTSDHNENNNPDHNNDSVNSDNSEGDKDILEHVKPNNAKDLRKQLLKELIALSEQGERQAISPVIIESEIYSKIQSLLAVQKPMKHNMWEELEKTVICASPRFNINLKILTQDKITKQERQTALLVKCGFKPVEMRSLLSITNGAINSRRVTLGAKILDEKRSVTFVDNIIRLL